MPVLGGATKQVFTYGKRGRRPNPSPKNDTSSDSEESSHTSEELPRKPTLVPASKARRELLSVQTASPPKARLLHTARKPLAFTSPRASSKSAGSTKVVRKSRIIPVASSLSSQATAEPLRSQVPADDRPRSTLPAKETVETTSRQALRANRDQGNHRTITPGARRERAEPSVEQNEPTNAKNGKGPSVKMTGPSDTGSYDERKQPIATASSRSESFPHDTTRLAAYVARRRSKIAGVVLEPPTSGRTPVDAIVITDSDDESTPTHPPESQLLPQASSSPTKPISSVNTERKLSSRVGLNHLAPSPPKIPQSRVPPIRPKSKPFVLITTPWSQPVSGKSTREEIRFASQPRRGPSTPARAHVSVRKKPRQVTPTIPRHGHGMLFPRPPSPPTPTTPSDFDLSRDFADLSISDVSDAEKIAENSSILARLLRECNQTSPLSFSSFITGFPSRINKYGSYAFRQADLNSDMHSNRSFRFCKIGEASYSEVFGIGSVVLKIIPLHDENLSESFVERDALPPPSSIQDVINEITVTRAMADVCTTGFVRLLDAIVVEGCYPSLLLELWDDFHEENDSGSIRPDGFDDSQKYAVIVLPNCGSDLETYEFISPAKSGWRHACSIFWQVACILAQAETLVRFEHRDLHWGQILIRDISDKDSNQRPKSAKKPLNDRSNGVEVTIIDLGFARMELESEEGRKVHFTTFDEEVFEGKGDYQFDVYRMMQTQNGGSWEEYSPLTNIMWLHYLAVKLLKFKHLRSPASSRKPTALSARDESIFSERDCYECLVQAENALGRSISGPNTRRQTARKSMAASKGGTFGAKPVIGPSGKMLTSATDLVDYGISQGWISRI